MLLRRDGRQHRARQGREEQRAPRAGQHQGRNQETVGHRRRHRGGEPAQRDRLRRQTADHQRAEADPVRDNTARRREQHGHDGHRQRAQARLQRRRAQPDLQQLSYQEQRAEHGGVHHERGQRADREHPVAEETHRQHRGRRPHLPGDEQHQQHHAAAQREAHSRCSPTPRRRRGSPPRPRRTVRRCPARHRRGRVSAADRRFPPAAAGPVPSAPGPAERSARRWRASRRCRSGRRPPADRGPRPARRSRPTPRARRRGARVVSPPRASSGSAA